MANTKHTKYNEECKRLDALIAVPMDRKRIHAEGEAAFRELTAKPPSSQYSAFQQRSQFEALANAAIETAARDILAGK